MMTASSCMYQTATTSHVCKIVNAVGEKETFALCGVFNLYNSVPDDGDSNVTSNARCIMNDAEVVCTSVREVKDAVYGPQTAKSADSNGFVGEI